MRSERERERERERGGKRDVAANPPQRALVNYFVPRAVDAGSSGVFGIN